MKPTKTEKFLPFAYARQDKIGEHRDLNILVSARLIHKGFIDLFSIKVDSRQLVNNTHGVTLVWD